jgi:hypothetical protein
LARQEKARRSGGGLGFFGSAGLELFGELEFAGGVIGAAEGAVGFAE